MADAEGICIDVFCRKGSTQAQWWFAHGFVGELEGAPVHRERSAAIAFDKGLDGFLGIYVHRLHDVARIVGADRNHAEIDRAMAFGDFPKGRTIAGIACVPEFAVRVLDQPPAPVAEVAIP